MRSQVAAIDTFNWFDIKLLTMKHCATLERLHTLLIMCVTHVYIQADDLHSTVHTFSSTLELYFFCLPLLLLHLPLNGSQWRRGAAAVRQRWA